MKNINTTTLGLALHFESSFSLPNKTWHDCAQALHCFPTERLKQHLTCSYNCEQFTVLIRTFSFPSCTQLLRTRTKIPTIFGTVNWSINIAESNHWVLTVSPSVVMSDFELASMNAARNHFPNVRIKGCLFHFYQNIWRHVMEKGVNGVHRRWKRT